MKGLKLFLCVGSIVLNLNCGTAQDALTPPTPGFEFLFVENTGIRTGVPEVLTRLAKGEDVPSTEYYMRMAARFEVDRDCKYSWLNNSVIISIGVRKADSVILDFYKVL